MKRASLAFAELALRERLISPGGGKSDEDPPRHAFRPVTQIKAEASP